MLNFFLRLVDYCETFLFEYSCVVDLLKICKFLRSCSQEILIYILIQPSHSKFKKNLSQYDRQKINFNSRERPFPKQINQTLRFHEIFRSFGFWLIHRNSYKINSQILTNWHFEFHYQKFKFNNIISLIPKTLKCVNKCALCNFLDICFQFLKNFFFL